MFQQVQTIFKSVVGSFPPQGGGGGIPDFMWQGDDRRIFLGLIFSISGFLSPGVRIPESGKFLLVEF